jgi:hypothetical protein
VVRNGNAVKALRERAFDDLLWCDDAITPVRGGGGMDVKVESNTLEVRPQFLGATIGAHWAGV